MILIPKYSLITYSISTSLIQKRNDPLGTSGVYFTSPFRQRLGSFPFSSPLPLHHLLRVIATVHIHRRQIKRPLQLELEIDEGTGVKQLDERFNYIADLSQEMSNNDTHLVRVGLHGELANRYITVIQYY